MAIERFEDLQAWQKSHELAREIYTVTNDGKFSRDFGLRDQIRRASVSVMSNIAEGFERYSRPDFHRFLVIAKASCAEVRSQLYLAYDIGYLDKDTFENLMTKARRTSYIINGLRKSVES